MNITIIQKKNIFDNVHMQYMTMEKKAAEEEEEDDRLPKKPKSFDSHQIQIISSRRRCRNLIIVVSLVLIVLGLIAWIIIDVSFILRTDDSKASCYPVRIPLCYKYKVPYSHTVVPNTLGQESQNEAANHLTRYEPLISVNCFSLLPLFLCTLYSPKCTGHGVQVPPCRSLCEDTKRHCDFFLGVFTLRWPVEFECEELPEGPDDCVGYEEIAELRRSKHVCTNGFKCDKGTRCLPNHWKCDGYPDCEDLTDEESCGGCAEENMFCGKGAGCISSEKVCDGKRDCPDARDEMDCLRLDIGGRVEGFVGSTKSWVPVCSEDWEQRNMSYWACRTLGYTAVKSVELRVESQAAHTRLALGIEIKKQRKPLFSSKQPCSSQASVFLKCQNYECGKITPSLPTPKFRIVGGIESNPGHWPWLVALHGGPHQVFFCGGVLISEWWVLSAAHCIGNQTDLSGWTLKLGMTRRTSASNGFTRGVSNIIKFPEFINLYSNDIALLLLDAPVQFGDYLRPVCLPPPNLNPMGEKCIVIGWGKDVHDDEAEYQMMVHEVEVPIVDFDLCSEWYSAQEVSISDKMLCAGYAEGMKDACQGDSGGPLVCKVNNRWVVSGVVSWGIKCAQPNLPGIYTNVPQYVEWLHNTTLEYGFPLDSH